MSKHEHIFKLIDQATAGLEQAAEAMEKLAYVIPIEPGPDFSIIEVLLIMDRIRRVEAAQAKLGASHLIMSARMGTSS